MTDDIKEGYQQVRKMLRDGMISKGIDPYGGYGETEPDDWQPIETAPKDGTFILVAVSGDFALHIMLVWWIDGWCWDMTNTPIVGEPTHWMPLPEPPKKP